MTPGLRALAAAGMLLTGIASSGEAFVQKQGGVLRQYIIDSPAYRRIATRR